VRKGLPGLAAVIAAAFIMGAAQVSPVVGGSCVADPHGCESRGSINSGAQGGGGQGFVDAEDAHNLYNATHPSRDPDITLLLLGNTDGANFNTVGVGSFSGTWVINGVGSPPGFDATFSAVNTDFQFKPKEFSSPISTGSWNGFDLPIGGDSDAPSQLLFGSDVGIAGSPGGAPEPTTWTMLIVGFLGLGAALRRRGRWSDIGCVGA
jgi:PEP-CTERM motif